MKSLIKKLNKTKTFWKQNPFENLCFEQTAGQLFGIDFHLLSSKLNQAQILVLWSCISFTASSPKFVCPEFCSLFYHFRCFAWDCCFLNCKEQNSSPYDHIWYEIICEAFLPQRICSICNWSAITKVSSRRGSQLTLFWPKFSSPAKIGCKRNLFHFKHDAKLSPILVNISTSTVQNWYWMKMWNFYPNSIGNYLLY